MKSSPPIVNKSADTHHAPKLSSEMAMGIGMAVAVGVIAITGALKPELVRLRQWIHGENNPPKSKVGGHDAMPSSKVAIDAFMHERGISIKDK